MVTKNYNYKIFNKT